VNRVAVASSVLEIFSVIVKVSLLVRLGYVDLDFDWESTSVSENVVVVEKTCDAVCEVDALGVIESFALRVGSADPLIVGVGTGGGVIVDVLLELRDLDGVSVYIGLLLADAVVLDECVTLTDIVRLVEYDNEALHDKEFVAVVVILEVPVVVGVKLFVVVFEAEWVGLRDNETE
jgi:hypothetical protein